MRKRVLVIEDEPQMLLGLRDNLEIEGYEVLTAPDGQLGLELALSSRPDLVILDLMLPGRSGLEVCRELRGRGSAVPVIMLTARSQEIDKVIGLETGADDYLTKPFGVAELLARARAVLRRASGQAAAPQTCTIGDVDVDFRTHQAFKGGERLALTSREIDLLRYLVARRGEVVTREQILSDVWGLGEAPPTRTIDNFVAKLRQKIEREPHQPEHLLTVHGLGYKFVG